MIPCLPFPAGRQGPVPTTPPFVWLLVGPSGEGKTTVCLRWVAQARAQGYRVAGVASPGVWMGQAKRGIRLRDLSHGEERLLAHRVAPDEVPTVGAWRFDPAVVAWGQAVLRRPVAADLVVVDELGPLEVVYGQGLTAAFDLLAQASYRAAVITVRPWLAELLAQRLRGLGLSPQWICLPQQPPLARILHLQGGSLDGLA